MYQNMNSNYIYGGGAEIINDLYLHSLNWTHIATQTEQNKIDK